MKIHTGYRCNLRCRFCYYGEELRGEDYTTDRLKFLLKFASKRGIRDIDFSGGEPTIRPDFPELLSYARKLGFRSICVITNGFMMADKEYTQKLVDAGLNEVLFSVHGNTKKINDHLTQVPGSFERLMAAIKNIKRLDVRFRTNTTVTKPNYKNLPDFARLFLKLKPSAVNFILFNPFYSTTEQEVEMTPRFSDCSPYIKRAIDMLDPHIEKITARCIPFCFMQDYEKFVCNAFQVKYDSDEWLPHIQARVEEVTPIKYYSYGLLDSFISKIFPDDSQVFSFLDSMITWNFVNSYYMKPKECNGCKYGRICESLKKGYVRTFGSREVKHVPGELIKNPVHFRRNYGSYGE